jgi:LmbE family N-acetylglucosaminyl deacetylase
MKIITKDIQSAIIIGAHPDDETCWAGGLVATYPNINWDSLICSVPADKEDKIRSVCYIRAAKELGIRNAMSLPFVEVKASSSLEMPLSILDFITTYDLIVTHSASGEYGHKHHKFIHKWVVQNVPSIPKLYFGYGKGEELVLSDKAYDIKMNALKCYDQSTRHHKEPKWEALLNRYPIIGEHRECFILEQ